MNIAEKVIRAKSDYDEVYDAGKQAEYDKFWDAFQLNGTRKNYSSAFACNVGQVWTDENYNPKYPITIREKSNQGNLLLAYNTEVTDTKVPIIYEDGLAGGISTVFTNAINLKTIRELHLVEGLTYTIAFNYLKALENLNITGVIGGEGFNVQWSTLLSKASIISIINALSTNTSGLTVTISKTAKENAFTDEEWATLIATKSNWTISLV